MQKIKNQLSVGNQSHREMNESQNMQKFLKLSPEVVS
jgi:hypothetical protein